MEREQKKASPPCRESFIFYRSFYEAIKCMPAQVQAEIYPAIMEYALLGKAPEGLSEVACGMFLLIKPNIDVNTTRFENGKKGGRKSARSPKKQAAKTTAYSLSFDKEVQRMESDAEWTASICEDYKISKDEYADRLKRFLKHCKETRKKKPHDSFDDAKSHMRYWMDKAFPQQAALPAPSSPPLPLMAEGAVDFGAAEYDEQQPANDFCPQFDNNDNNAF